jgi:HK97 family phage portal protein
LVVMAMGMQGYAVVEKVRSAAGLPVELWPLRPDWLVPHLDPLGRKTTRWDYRVPGAAVRVVAADDLIVVPYRHDERQERPGVSPLQVAAREVGIESALTDFLKTYLDSGGIPPFVIEYDDPIADQAVIDQIQASWAQKYGGSRAYGQIPILHGGYRISQVGDSLNAMAWPDLRAITEDKICQAFRVPRELVQTHSTANGGSGLTTTEQEGAMASLQRYGATPLRNRIDGALTRGLLFEFTGGDPAYELAFDVRDVLALQEDEDKRHARVRSDWQAGLLTLDEARVELGLQPLPRGQGGVFAVPFSVVFTRPEHLAAPTPAPAIPATVPPKAARTYRDVKALRPAELELRAGAVAGNRRAQQKLAEVLDRKLRGLFAEQAERIAGAVAKNAKGITQRFLEAAPRPIEDAVFKSLVDIDWQAEEDALRAILARFYDEAGGMAFAQASSLLGVEIAWDLANPNVNRVVTLLGTRIRAVAETTRQDVARTIADGLSEGQTLDQLADSVRGLLGGESYKGRALTIARTESMTAYNSASVVGYQESGVVTQVELADNDKHTEGYGASDGLTCAERNGLVVELEAVSRHIAAEHPNGSLAVLPIVQLGEG